MPKQAIWDTNVFRNVGAGDITLSDARNLVTGAQVRVSPVTILELASRYTPESFEHRRLAAQAVLDSGAVMLPDPEAYLTREVFGFALNEDEFDWSQAVHAMAQSSSIAELQMGVSDYLARVRRRVNLANARHYRDGIDHDFVKDMLSIQIREIPGFTDWWDPDPQKRVGPVPRLTGGARDVALATLQELGCFVTLLEACRERALFKTNDTLPWPPTPDWVHRLVAAWNKLEFYFHMYRGYLSRLLTTGTLARNNDWFDLEILLYSAADDHVVVTTDKKWPSIALDEGVNHRIVHLRT